MSPRIRVAGLGNVFFGDDGFGVEVARWLSKASLPAGVTVSDVGVRGIHLAFELLEPVDFLVVVDLAPRGGAPGTLYVIDPELEPSVERAAADPHGMDLSVVFDAVRTMGGTLPRIRIVGCEPHDVAPGIGLSDAVAAAVGPATEIVLELVHAEIERSAPDRKEIAS